MLVVAVLKLFLNRNRNISVAASLYFKGQVIMFLTSTHNSHLIQVKLKTLPNSIGLCSVTISKVVPYQAAIISLVSHPQNYWKGPTLTYYVSFDISMGTNVEKLLLHCFVVLNAPSKVTLLIFDMFYNIWISTEMFCILSIPLWRKTFFLLHFVKKTHPGAYFYYFWLELTI